MKKLLIATGVLSALIMTGCATNPKPNDMPVDDMHHHHHGKKHHHGKHHHGKMVEHYTCEQNATVNVKYKKDTALLNITAPSLTLNNQDISLTRAVSGSGMRFVNETNPASKYEWHAKNGEAIFGVTVADGKTYEFSCQSDDMPPPPPEADDSMDDM